MDLGNMGKKLIGTAEDNASLLTFALASYARVKEGDTQLGANAGISEILGYFVAMKPPSAMNEIKNAFTGYGSGGINYGFKYKLWDAPHLNTQLFKYGAIIWAVGQFLDVIPKRWIDLAGKIAIGAGASAIIMPSSNGHMTSQGQANPTAGGANYSPQTRKYPTFE